MLDVDAAWLAGIIEGEGCLEIMNNSTNKNVLRIRVGMTDLDVVEKVALLMNTTVKTNQITKGGKQFYTTSISRPEKVREVLTNIKPYMGKRRLAKITDMFNTLELRGK